MSQPYTGQSLSLVARRVLWDQVWNGLLQPPRREPAEPEHVPTPDELTAFPPRSAEGVPTTS